MALDQLTSELAAAERELERDIGQARAMATNAKRNAERARELDARAESLEEAIGLLNSFADQRQAEVQRKIELLVTHGLQQIFGDDLSFHIIQESKARRSEVRFTIRSVIDGAELETGIMDSRGGGVAAVAGFLLRLIVLLLRPDRRHFILLDETFAQLSAEYEPRLAEFIRELVDKTSVQLLLITHSPQFQDVADVAYRFTLKNGRTQAERLL